MSKPLFLIVQAVESSSGKALMKTEPAVVRQAQTLITPGHGAAMAKILELHKCDQVTAEYIYGTSWGNYQFLGATLYSEGLADVPVWTFMELASDQDKAFDDWCLARRFNPQGPLPSGSELFRFAGAWNGPGAVAAYVSKLQAADDE